MSGIPQPQPYANSYGVDVAVVAGLIERAPGALALIREDTSELRAEVDIEGGGVRGRIDAIGLRMAGHKLFSTIIIDWKTGRDPEAGSKPLQRLAYASAAEATYGMPATRYVYTAEVWLAAEEIRETRFDIDSIQGFRTRLAEKLKYRSASPGACCTYCARRHECDERNQYIRHGIDAIQTYDAGSAMVDNAAALWEQSRMAKRALEQYERIVDALLEQHGSLQLPDGHKLVHAHKVMDQIDARKAWPIMKKHGLTNEHLAAITRISKPALLDAVGEAAPQGQKGERRKALMTELDLVGAISRTKSRYKRIIK